VLWLWSTVAVKAFGASNHGNAKRQHHLLSFEEPEFTVTQQPRERRETIIWAVGGSGEGPVFRCEAEGVTIAKG
jgi:hypothetical protein